MCQNKFTCLFYFTLFMTSDQAPFVFDGVLNREMELVDSPEQAGPSVLGSINANSHEISAFHRSGSRVDAQEQYAFQEACIYLEKGVANEKYHEFNDHLDKSRFVCYLIVHTTLYKVLDVVSSVMLLALAAIEPPAMLGMDVPIWLHGALEISCLLILIVVFGIKIKWQGIHYSKYHRRTLFKLILIITMTTEVIVVLSRENSHVRVTRALRPLFLLDTHYFGGVRRVFRDILKSMPPVMDIFGLLLFFMVIFSILGFYFFSTNENDPNFTTIQRSFISLFVLVTTANYPDVMMPAFHHNKGAVFFFVIYLAVALYFFMNLLLATVYSTFTMKNISKFKKLYIHKREGSTLAYNKINDPVNDGIDFPKFRKLLKTYKPRMTSVEKVLTFKFLDQRRSGRINLEEFRHIYGATELSWRRYTNSEWFYYWDFPGPVRKALRAIHSLVTKSHEKSFYSYFDIFIYIVIFINGCTVLSEVIDKSNMAPSDRNLDSVPWFSHVFTAVYVSEALLKLLALGIRGYFDSYWNWFDILVTVLNLLGSFDQGVTFALYLRPIRLLLLFKLRKSYRVVFDTLRILFASLINLGIVIVLFYYFFAIIGIEAFGGVNLKSCCRNSSIQNAYEENGYYYLNNFNDFFHSYVTLFELTVINNWHVIMEGFAVATSEWSRIFFMVFYVVILVVMTIVVAFILDAFVFTIELRKKNRNSEKDTHKVVQQTYLRKEELGQIDPRLVRPDDTERIIFIAERILTRDDLVEEMHREELEALCRDFDDTLHRSQQTLQVNPSYSDQFQSHDHSTVSSLEEDT